MGAIVLDANKINSYVLPNLSKSENTMQTAYNTSVSFKNSLPSSFYYRSTVNDIVSQIYKIQREIKDVDKIIETKVDRAKSIQKKADSKVSSLSSAVSKVGATIGSAVIGAATGGVVGAAVGATTGAVVATAATKPKNNTGAKQSKSFLSKVGDFFVGAWNGIKKTASKISNGIKSIWQKFTGAIKNIGKKVVDATKKVGKAIYSTGAKIAKGVVSGVKKFGSAIVDGFKWVGSKVVSGVKTAAKWVGNTAKTVTNWIADKFNAVKDWTSNALKSAGAWISKTANAAWTWIKDAASTVWTHMKKIGASFVNGVISLVKGVVKLIEAIGDLVILVGAGIGTIGTAIWDTVKGIATGKWDWSATKGLWKGTKAVVAYDWTSKCIFDPLYNTSFGKWLDDNAYSPFKSTGLGCKILEGVGYVGGVVVISIFTFGAGGAALGAAAGTTATIGGISVSATAVGLTAAAAGIGKYTQEEWNKNSLSITYGGQEMGLTIDYQKYSEIEKLKDGQSTTITQQFTDENGKPFELKFTITKNGDTYSVTDSNGNAVGFNGVKESSTVGGLGMGVLKGLGDGFKYYTAVSTIGNVQQFTSMAKSIGGGNTLQGFKSMASNFGVKQSLKPLVTNAAKNTFTDVGFYIDSGTHIYTDIETYMKTGEFNILKTGAKIVGAYGINFMGNVAGEYFSKGLNTSLTNIQTAKQLDYNHSIGEQLNDIDNQLLKAEQIGDYDEIARLQQQKSLLNQEYYSTMYGAENVAFVSGVGVEGSNGSFVDPTAAANNRLLDYKYDVSQQLDNIDGQIMKAEQLGDYDTVIKLQQQKSLLTEEYYRNIYGANKVDYISGADPKHIAATKKTIESKEFYILETYKKQHGLAVDDPLTFEELKLKDPEAVKQITYDEYRVRVLDDKVEWSTGKKLRTDATQQMQVEAIAKFECEQDGIDWNTTSDEIKQSYLDRVDTKSTQRYKEVYDAQLDAAWKTADGTIKRAEELVDGGYVKTNPDTGKPYTSDEIIRMVEAKVPQSTYLTSDYIETQYKPKWGTPDADGNVTVVAFQSGDVGANNYAKFGGNVGSPDGMFVMPKSEADAILAKCRNSDGTLNISQLTEELGGVPFGSNVVMIEQKVNINDIELPDGSLSSAYLGDWCPGGSTSGGITEGVIRQTNYTDPNVTISVQSGNPDQIKILDEYMLDKEIEAYVNSK